MCNAPGNTCHRVNIEHTMLLYTKKVISKILEGRKEGKDKVGKTRKVKGLHAHTITHAQAHIRKKNISHAFFISRYF